MPKRSSATSPSETGLTSNPTKKARISNSTAGLLTLQREYLEKLSAADLVIHVEGLQTTVRQHESQLAAIETSAPIRQRRHERRRRSKEGCREGKQASQYYGARDQEANEMGVS